MQFCNKCSYIFDIAESSDVSQKDNRKSISKINDIFTLLEEKADLSNYKISIKKDELLKNKKYQKLDDNEKNIIDNLFKEFKIYGCEFKCNNCNNNKQITETTLLFQLNTNNKKDHINSIEENKLITTNPLLPRTKDYTCKNNDCKTHKAKSNKEKEAVFYRDKNSYKVNYICSICYYKW
jgi:hypothetical protein